MASFTSLFPNRVFAAAGCFGFGDGWWFDHVLGVFPESFGAVVTKTITVEPRRGCYTWPVFRSLEPWLAPRKAVRTLPRGFVNRLQVPNPGISDFAYEIIPRLSGKVRLIVSLAGATEDEFSRMISRLDHLPAASVSVLAYELNVSCPNLGRDWHWQADLRRFDRLLRECRRISRRPLIVKLGYPHWLTGWQQSDHVRDIARSCEQNGVAAIAAINTIPVDPINGKPWLEAFPGGGSGSMISDFAREMISRLRDRTDLPIIGIGGIECARDCEQFRSVGATMVALGSAAHLPWVWPPKRWLQPRQTLRILSSLRTIDERYWFNTKPISTMDPTFVVEASSP